MKYKQAITIIIRPNYEIQEVQSQKACPNSHLFQVDWLRFSLQRIGPDKSRL